MNDGGSVAYTTETWVEVPRGYQVALAGFRSNPASGAPTVAFSLADASPVRLEVLDVSGRLVEARDVGRLGAGRRALRLEAPTLRPGMYWLPLVQAGTVRATARGLLTR